MKARELTKIALCVALLCSSAYIAIPLPLTPAPIVLLTLVLNIIGLILNPKEAFLVTLVYVLLGVIGVPVFAGGTAGIGVLFGPTGGFILAYMVAAPLMSIVKGKSNDFKRYLISTIGFGMITLYVFGTIFMCLVLKVGIMESLTMAVFPFIIGDLVKCVAGSYIALKLNSTVFKTVEA